MKLQLHLRPRQKTAKRKPTRSGIYPQFVYLGMIVAIISGIGYAMYATYNLIDRALSSSEVVIRLRQEVSDEMFKSDDYEKAIAHMEAKQRQAEPTDWTTVINPFQSSRPPTQQTSANPPPSVDTP